MLEAVRHEFEEWLGHDPVSFVLGIVDDNVRERTMASLELCIFGLEVLDQLDITERNITQAGESAPEIWATIAPDLRNVVVAIRTAVDGFSRIHPNAPPEDDGALDFSFEIVDGQALLSQRKDRSALAIDSVVSQAKTGDPAAAASLTHILSQELVLFKDRLRSPQVLDDRWFLASEVQEFHTKTSKCLEAIVVSTLRGAGYHAGRPLPDRFQPEHERSAKLREVVVEFLLELRRAADTLKAQPELGIKIYRNVLTAFDHVMSQHTYRWVRVQDKRRLLELRRRIAENGATVELRGLLHEALGELEIMRGINQRSELITRDREQLEAARLMLDAGLDVTTILPHIAQVYGRSPSLDDWLRAHREGQHSDPESLMKLVEDALARIAPAQR